MKNLIDDLKDFKEDKILNYGESNIKEADSLIKKGDESIKIRDAFPNGISNDESRVVRERLERLISSLLDAPKQPVILNEFEGAYVWLFYD